MPEDAIGQKRGKKNQQKKDKEDLKTKVWNLKVENTHEKIKIEEKGGRDDLDIKIAENVYSTYEYMRVHFIDVGQGDCSFVELSNEKSRSP